MADFDFFYPFDSVSSDRQTTAATERRFWAALFSGGVVGSGFAATESSSGVYSIATGICLVGGAVGGTTSAQTITAQPTSGSSKYIVARLDTNSAVRKISLSVVDTPITTTTQAQLEQGGQLDLVLYKVTNTGGTYSIEDKRTYCTSFDNVQFNALFTQKMQDITLTSNALLAVLQAQFEAAIAEAEAETSGLYGSAGRQGFMNPAFLINQRGETTYSLLNGTIATVDRWLARIGGRTASSAVTVSRAQDGDRSALVIANKTYASGSGAGASCILQNIERGLRTFCRTGSSFTVAFDAKASASCKLAVEPVQYADSSTAGVALTAQSVNLTTSWQRFTLTFTGNVSPATVTADDVLKIGFFFAWVNSTDRFGADQNAANTFYLANMQINSGSEALSAYVKPYGAELADCERFYKRFNGLSMAVGAQNTSSLAYCTSAIPVPASMAAVPAVTVYDRNNAVNKGSVELTNGTWVNNLAVSVSSYGNETPSLVITGTSSSAATRAVFNRVELNAENMTL